VRVMASVHKEEWGKSGEKGWALSQHVMQHGAVSVQYKERQKNERVGQRSRGKRA